MKSRLLSSLWVICALLFTGCDDSIVPGDLSQRARLSEQDAESLFLPLYLDAPQPPVILQEEYQSLLDAYLEKARGETSDEAKENIRRYQEFFHSRPDLAAYLLLDTDGDGTKDYYFHTDRGILVPLDSDIDGDGVENIMDEDPFVPGSGSLVDRDGNGIPDHLQMRDADAARSQERVFRETGVLAFGRTARHASGSLQSFEIVSKTFFGRLLSRHHNRFPYLKYFIAEDEIQYHSEGGLAGLHNPTEQSITMTNDAFRTLSQSNSAWFGMVLVHEFGHALQYEQEMEIDEDYPERNYLNYFFSPDGFRGTGVEARTGADWAKLAKDDPSGQTPENTETQPWIISEDNFRNPVALPMLALNPVQLTVLNGTAIQTPSVLHRFPLESSIARGNRMICLSARTQNNPREYFAESVVAYVLRVMFEKQWEQVPAVYQNEEARILLRNHFSLFTSVHDLNPFNLDRRGFYFMDRSLRLLRNLSWDSQQNRWTRDES